MARTIRVIRVLVPRVMVTEGFPVPDTTDLLVGDGVGGIADSSIAPEDVLTLPIELSGVRIKADGTFQLWNPDQSLYHTISVNGAAGEEVLTIGAGEA